MELRSIRLEWLVPTYIYFSSMPLDQLDMLSSTYYDLFELFTDESTAIASSHTGILGKVC